MKKLNKIKIIAEIGVNHDGSLSKAKKLIKIAKKCGADYVKFQMFCPDEIVTEYAGKAKYQIKKTSLKITQKQMLKRYYFNEKKIKSIYFFCKKIGIKFLASVFDEKSFDILKNFKIDFVKLPSSEITNFFLLKKIKEFRKLPILFSTGMSTSKEINNFLNFFKYKNFYLIPMYCVSSYPTNINEINLKKLEFLKKKFKLYGFSDHTVSFEASILLVANGCKIIERHLTYSNSANGPDHEASLNPKKFKIFVEMVRNSEIILKNSNKNFKEYQNLKFVRKFIVAKNKIKKGDKFLMSNLAAKRTGKFGICPSKYTQVLNKVAKKNFQVDELIKI